MSNTASGQSKDLRWQIRIRASRDIPTGYSGKEIQVRSRHRENEDIVFIPDI